MAISVEELKFMNMPGDRKLWQILQAVQAGGNASEVTPTTTTVTEDGEVAAGARSVQFILSEDFEGTINGAAYDGSVDAVVPFDPIGEHLYSAIEYTITAGSLRIIRIA